MTATGSSAAAQGGGCAAAGGERARHRAVSGDEAKVGGVVAADDVDIRVDVDQRACGAVAPQGVAAGGRIVEACAEHQHAVGCIGEGGGFGMLAVAEKTGRAGVRVVEEVLAAEGRHDRDGVGGSEALERGTLGVRPVAADDDQRPFGHRQHRAHTFDIVRGRRRRAHRERRHRTHRGRLGEHVLGQRQHHRAGPAAGGEMEGAGERGRQVVGLHDLLDVLGQRREVAQVVDFLEGLAAEVGARHLADTDDQRDRALARHMDGDRGIGRARPAGDEDHARAPRQPRRRARHEGRPALVAGRD
jgi:hypothetical protein